VSKPIESEEDFAKVVADVMERYAEVLQALEMEEECRE
jgi:hypothetical protein